MNKTPITRNLFSLKIDPPLIIKAIAMWDITRTLKTTVREKVSELVTLRVSLNVSKKKAARKNPVVKIKINLWLLRIGALGFLGLCFKTVGSLASLAKARAGMPSVTRLIQRI